MVTVRERTHTWTCLVTKSCSSTHNNSRCDFWNWVPDHLLNGGRRTKKRARRMRSMYLAYSGQRVVTILFPSHKSFQHLGNTSLEESTSAWALLCTLKQSLMMLSGPSSARDENRVRLHAKLLTLNCYSNLIFSYHFIYFAFGTTHAGA